MAGANNIIRQVDDHVEFTIYGQGKEETALCDIDDVSFVKLLKWRIGAKGAYVVAAQGEHNVSFHRLVCPVEGNKTVDHVNRNTFDNRRSNLRPATARIQNINRIIKQKKDLPPGIQHVTETPAYRVSWSEGADDIRRRNYPINLWGERKARDMALRARMLKIITIPDYRESLFKEDDVRRTMLSEGENPDTDIPTALHILMDSGYNLWNLVYDGQYSHLAEEEEWTPDRYRKAATQRVMDAFDALQHDFYDTEMLDKFDAYFTDLWRTSNHYAPDMIVGGATRANFNSYSTDEDLDKLDEEGISEQSSIELGKLNDARLEAMAAGKGYEFALIVGRCIGQINKMLHPPLPVEKTPRNYKPDPLDSIKGWSTAHVSEEMGVMIDCKVAHSKYLQWCVEDELHRGKGIGYVIFLHYMEEYGYKKVSRAGFEGVKIV